MTEGQYLMSKIIFKLVMHHFYIVFGVFCQFSFSELKPKFNFYLPKNDDDNHNDDKQYLAMYNIKTLSCFIVCLVMHGN